MRIPTGLESLMIEVHELTKKYGEKVAVDDLTSRSGPGS